MNMTNECDEGPHGSRGDHHEMLLRLESDLRRGKKLQ